MKEVRSPGTRSARRPDGASSGDLVRDQSGSDTGHTGLQISRRFSGRPTVRDELRAKAVDLALDHSVERSADELVIVSCPLRSGFGLKTAENWRGLEVAGVDEFEHRAGVSRVRDNSGGIRKPSDADGIPPQLVGQRLLAESAYRLRWLFATDCATDAPPGAVQPREDIAVRHAPSVSPLADIVKHEAAYQRQNVRTLGTGRRL